MKRNHRAWLAAGLLAGAAALTGCSAVKPLEATPQPQSEKITAQPQTDAATVSPDESPEAEETPAALALSVDGREIEVGAVMEREMLFLPLEETAKALGWNVKREETQEETRLRKSVQLAKEESVITVSWVCSDNTIKQLTWQKDGLLIPVDTEMTSVDGVIYVPSAFFETAMRVQVDKQESAVAVHPPKPQDTPVNNADDAGDADRSEEKEETENG